MNILEIGIEQGIENGINLGMAKALVKNVESIMKNLGMGLDEACKSMEISTDEYYEAKKVVQNTNIEIPR